MKDSWEKVIGVTDSSGKNIGTKNPFRYRGYYYDEESGFYYLGSRYYDPEVGRFINADDTDYLGADGNPLSYNLFAYCFNNPVNMTDDTGHWPKWATNLVKVGIGALAIFGSDKDEILSLWEVSNFRLHRFLVYCYIILDTCFWIPVICSIIRIYSIIRPYIEQFEIQEDIIVVKNGKKKTKKALPKEMVLIISYVDTCPLFTKRTAVGNETHILKDKYAVSIIEKMPVEDVIEHLHRSCIQSYTTSTIKDSFEEHRYIYSFVYDRNLLEQITCNRRCIFIIPKSLVDKVGIETEGKDIYIDILC